MCGVKDMVFSELTTLMKGVAYSTSKCRGYFLASWEFMQRGTTTSGRDGLSSLEKSQRSINENSTIGTKKTLNPKHEMCKTNVKLDLYYASIYANMNMKRTWQSYGVKLCLRLMLNRLKIMGNLYPLDTSFKEVSQDVSNLHVAHVHLCVPMCDVRTNWNSTKNELKFN